jgi:type III pantothenate kinase
MIKTLCLDFGNTRLKAAIFNGEELEEKFVLNGDGLNDLSTILQKFKPTISILSSVVHHQEKIEELLSSSTQFHKLTNESKLPFMLPVGKPDTMGADRLAIAAAAVYLFPRTNNLAIGLGSCITYNFINCSHEFLGGSISPGVEMRFKAMNYYTAKLPLVKAEWNIPLIGYDTATNLQTGVILGIAKEMDGVIEEFESKFGNFNVLLTGGDIAFFEPHLKKKIFAHPDLLFKGLYAISKVNVLSN